ncbi:MAG: hypothetical protein AB8V10_02095 [Francisella endosymbiont of Hyalomma asiaticum]
MVAKSLSEYTDIKLAFKNYVRIKYTKSQAKSLKQKKSFTDKSEKWYLWLTKPIIAKHLLVLMMS